MCKWLAKIFGHDEHTLLRNHWCATLRTMSDDPTIESEELRRLRASAAVYSRLKPRYDAALKAVKADELAALQAGEPVPAVAAASPLSYEHVRTVADKHGIARDENMARRPKPPKTEMVVVEVDARTARLYELWDELDADELALAARIRALPSGNVGVILNDLAHTEVYRQVAPDTIGAATPETFDRAAHDLLTACLVGLARVEWPASARAALPEQD